MTLNDALKRIIGGHLVILLGFLVLGVAAGLGVHSRQPASYLASARVVFGSSVPRSEAESSALASTARAIVTSPTEVAAAVEASGARRDAATVAASHVTLSAMGSSNVFRLSVTDREPHVAAALANRLAQGVVDIWDRQQEDAAQHVVADLDSQISGLHQQIDTIDRSLSAPANAGGGPAASTLLARRADVSRQIADLGDQRSHVAADDALRSKPWVLQPATPPNGPQPSGLAQDLTLGALLGLVAGIGVAAAVETFRPRLLGARAQATVLDVPVLGEYTVRGSSLTGDELQTLSRRFHLAAHAHQLAAVALVDLSRRDRRQLDSASLAVALVNGSSTEGEPAVDLTEEETVPASRTDLLVARPSHWSPRAKTEPAPSIIRQTTRHRLRVLPFDAASAEQVRVPTGFVVITPPGLPTREIARVEDVRRTTGWPLLGVVCVRATRWVTVRERCRGMRPRRTAQDLATTVAGSQA